MAEKTFQKEIEFLTKTYVQDSDSWEPLPITKTATFKELSAIDKTQHKLHFKILSLTDILGKEEATDKVSIDTDVLYDLTVKTIKTLLVIDDKFTATDKEEFLSDSMALLSFGMWMLTEHTLPFFSKFNGKLKPTQ